MDMIDFTNCRTIIGKAYNGANGKKIAVEYNGDAYMIKFPVNAYKKPTELSYTNSCISEHIGSTIFNMLGVKAQETLLGTYRVNGKEKVVCACKDFTENGKQLYDFCSIKNTIIDSEHNGNGTELSEILETIEKQQFVEPDMLLEHFWRMFVIDALLGNFDRHNGNWGFLYANKTKTSEIAPIFDCGSCLLPQADEKTMKQAIENVDVMNSRIYVFPKSAIKLNESKINYCDFLRETDNADCLEAVKEIYDKVNMKEITDFIQDIPYITELQKCFYSKYLEARFEKVIKMAYDHIMEKSDIEIKHSGMNELM